jgi:hypothetical protein
MSSLADIRRVPSELVDECYELECEGQVIKGIVKDGKGSIVVIGAIGYGDGLVESIEPSEVRARMLKVEKRIKTDLAMRRGEPV